MPGTRTEGYTGPANTFIRFDFSEPGCDIQSACIPMKDRPNCKRPIQFRHFYPWLPFTPSIDIALQFPNVFWRSFDEYFLATHKRRVRINFHAYVLMTGNGSPCNLRCTTLNART